MPWQTHVAVIICQCVYSTWVKTDWKNIAWLKNGSNLKSFYYLWTTRYVGGLRKPAAWWKAYVRLIFRTLQATIYLWKNIVPPPLRKSWVRPWLKCSGWHADTYAVARTPSRGPDTQPWPGHPAVARTPRQSDRQEGCLDWCDNGWSSSLLLIDRECPMTARCWHFICTTCPQWFVIAPCLHTVGAEHVW